MLFVKTIEDIEKYIYLSNDEKEWFKKYSGRNNLQFLVSENVLSCIKRDEIRNQFIPRVQEFNQTDSLDPQEEEKHKATGRLIHRYKHHAAFIVTEGCFSYCRYCFRRRLTSKCEEIITPEEIEEAAHYIKENSIDEILITGGDPLFLSNDRLFMIFSKIREAVPNIIIRLCTRSLLSNPDRFDDELLKMLKNFNTSAPLFLLVQFNSAYEFTKNTISAIERVRKSSIVMFNQSVLLKGVNDNSKTLIELSNTLLYHSIKPYYLFISDKVGGTEHFRVSVKDALLLYDEMRESLSGLKLPVLACDLPQGGGKVPICKNHIRRILPDDSAELIVNGNVYHI